MNNGFGHGQPHPFQGNPSHSQLQFGRNANSDPPPQPHGNHPSSVQHSPSPPRPLHVPMFSLAGQGTRNPGPFSSPPPLVPPPGLHHPPGLPGQAFQPRPRPQSAHGPCAPPPTQNFDPRGSQPRPSHAPAQGFAAPPPPPPSAPVDSNRFSGPQFPSQPQFTSPPRPPASFLMGYGASAPGRQRPYIPPFGSPVGSVQLNNVRNLPPKPSFGAAPPRLGSDPSGPSPMHNFGSKPSVKGKGFQPKLDSQVSSGSGNFYGLDDIDD